MLSVSGALDDLLSSLVESPGAAEGPKEGKTSFAIDPGGPGSLG